MTVTSLDQLFTYLLLSVAETFILHRLLMAFLNRNQVLARYYRQGLAAYFAFQMLSYFMGAPLFSTAALYFLFTMAIASLFFTDSLQMKASVSSIFVVLNYACKVLAVTLLVTGSSQPLPDLPHDLVLDWAAQITACFLFWSCVFLIIWFRRLRLKNHQLTYTLITYIVPMGVLFIVMRMFYHNHDHDVASIYLDAAGLLFCTALALFYLIDKSVVIDQTTEQQLVTLQLMTTQGKYYQHLDQFQREIQSIRHDMKNHIKCAMTMMSLGENEAAREYLGKLYESTAKLESPLHCGNRVVDIVLNHSLANMRKYGLRLEANVLLPPDLPPIDELDLCTLFGNLLDNAVEACNRIADPEADRYVSLNAGVRKGYLFVTISNSFNGEVRLENNIYQTVKTGERFCGIGLSNIRRVVEKYNGDLSIRHGDGIFTVSAMLGIEDAPKQPPITK